MTQTPAKISTSEFRFSIAVVTAVIISLACAFWLSQQPEVDPETGLTIPDLHLLR